MTPWEIKGLELVNCTCEYGCNCQFDALPDKGHCHAVAGIQIDEGHYGETKLDGLRIAAIFKWPGAIHEGNCEAIAFVDENADAAAARGAVEDHDGARHRPVCDDVRCLRLDCHQNECAGLHKIDLELDIDGRRGRIFVKDYIDTKGEPIRNKVTGAGIACANRVAGRLRIRSGRDRQCIEQDQGSGPGRDERQLRPVRPTASQQSRRRAVLTRAACSKRRHSNACSNATA